MADKILVTGAGGTVGRDVVRLLAEKGAKVVACVHTPTKVADFDWPEEVEVVRFDWEESETWERAVPGVDRVMLIAPPVSPAHLLMVPAIDYIHREGVWKFVLLSALGIDYSPEAPLRRVEVHLDRTGTTNTFLRANWFMQNFSTLFRKMIDRGELALAAGAGKTSFVDTRDVAECAAEALLHPEVHGNQEYELTGPEDLNHREVAEIISKERGREVNYLPVNEQDMVDRLVEDGFPRKAVQGLVSLYGPVRDGKTAAVSDDVERILNRPPKSFREFAQEIDWSPQKG